MQRPEAGGGRRRGAAIPHGRFDGGEGGGLTSGHGHTVPGGPGHKVPSGTVQTGIEIKSGFKWFETFSNCFKL
jgi:hypothetical protein